MDTVTLVHVDTARSAMAEPEIKRHEETPMIHHSRYFERPADFGRWLFGE
jgi:hypothetical protein